MEFRTNLAYPKPIMAMMLIVFLIFLFLRVMQSITMGCSALRHQKSVSISSHL